MKILKFSTSKCIPCKNMKNVLLHYKMNHPSIEIEEIEDDFDRMSLLKIRTVPYLIIENNDKKITHSGEISYHEFCELVKPLEDEKS